MEPEQWPTLVHLPGVAGSYTYYVYLLCSQYTAVMTNNTTILSSCIDACTNDLKGLFLGAVD